MQANEPRRVNPEALAAPGGHYSHGSVANGLVFVSGQLPVTPAGLKLTDAPFEQQARQVLDNVRAVLEACGSSVDKLVQVRVYVASLRLAGLQQGVLAIWDAKPRGRGPTGPLHYGFLVKSRRWAWGSEAHAAAHRRGSAGAGLGL